MVKFEALKEKIIREEITKIERLSYGTNYSQQMLILFDSLSSQRPYDKSKEAIISEITSIINRFDIRRAEHLRELFPYAFNGKLKKGKLYAEMDEEGDWVIFNNAIDL